MTNKQYSRWKDFALRMARTCYRTSRRPPVDWIVAQVEGIFERVEQDDICCIRDWDHSDDYPPGHPYHRQAGYWYCRQDPATCTSGDVAHGTHCRGGLHYRFASAPLVGDLVNSMLSYEEPVFCDKDGEPLDDDRADVAGEQWGEQWGGPVLCCIRAGLDMASAPSAGVIGFTAGDIRAMYPGGVPDWVFPPGERLSYWPGGEPDGYFTKLPDAAVVVL